MKKIKKIFILCSVAALILTSFAGCGNENASDTNNSNQEQTEQNAGTNESTAGDTQQGGSIIETGFYYTITLPGDWNGKYICNDIEDNVSSCLAFYEKESADTEYGGHLFTVMLLPESEDYTQYPSYDYMGVLKTPEGDFNMVVLYPTDVQFSEDTSKAYNNLVSGVEQAVKTIKAAEGAELVSK